METNISDRIGGLNHLSRQQLLDLWEQLFKKQLSPGIRREVMIPLLAYRIQEIEYGGIKTTARTELRRLVRALEKGPSSALSHQPRQIKTGTRLSRQWHGEMHEVSVTESGFEYRGVKYRSLSKIACKIAGTRWSGPAFFGLNKRSGVTAAK